MGGQLERRSVLGGLAVLAAGPASSVARAAPGVVPLTFLHFNDVYRHGSADGFGGLAEFATLLDEERARAPGAVIVTFGGDVLSPSVTSAITHGAHMIELLNALGVDVAVLGNHEFDFGSEVARQRIGESLFPWLGANVLGPDGQVFGGAVATCMREAGGLRVGFVGVLTRDTAQLAPHADGVAFGDEAAALRAGAAALRAEGADVVVALTHQIVAADMVVARAVPGIDLVLGGHDHEPMELQNLPGVPVLKAASDARFLAVAELRVAAPGRGVAAHVRSVGWKLVPNVDVAPSLRIAPLVAEIDARTAGVLGEPIARLGAPLDSRRAVVRTEEAALGDLVADALRAYFSADVALVNGGGLRGNRLYPDGAALTRRDFLTEMPFNNAVVKLEVPGAVLLDMLEQGLAGVEAGAGGFPQVSGLRVVYDPAAPAGRRVREVTVGGRPLNPMRAYSLATVDYLAAGGDGYGMLRTARVLVDASGGPLLVNVVSDAVAGMGGELVVQTDGRVMAQR